MTKTTTASLNSRSTKLGTKRRHGFQVPLVVLFTSHRRTMVEHVVALRLPSIHHLPEIVEDGGLVSYGARLTLMYRQMVRQPGARLADQPGQEPPTFPQVASFAGRQGSMKSGKARKRHSMP